MARSTIGWCSIAVCRGDEGLRLRMGKGTCEAYAQDGGVCWAHATVQPQKHYSTSPPFYPHEGDDKLELQV